MFIKPDDKERFFAELEKQNAKYNPKTKALAQPFSSPGYHTTLKGGVVHSTRTAFEYAMALLDSNITEYRLRAADVLDGALRLQDTDPSNATYGIWPWFYEESLEQMSPPDWNWADFCGKELLMISHYHRDNLPADLYERVKEAIRHACLSIFRRNMHSGYTNISIMGSFVTMCAGEELGFGEMFDYGKRRFAKFHAFTMANGAFSEYNSPTYTMVAIEDLTRIHGMIKDGDVHKMAEDMLDIAWRTVAEHFHSPTRQWAGPHARAYQCLQSDRNLTLIQRASHGEVSLVDDAHYDYSLSWAHLDFNCPPKYREMFIRCVPHEANCRFGGMDTLLRPVTVPEVATCYVTEEYALGSFVRSDTWNQRRNMLGYWGGENVRFMSWRLLHDFYDYSSGMMTIAQAQGNALVAASFITDGGDTHCNLDMVKNATIRASDLRLRIELCNLSEKPIFISDNTGGAQNSVSVRDGGISQNFILVGGQFDGNPVSLSISNSDDPNVSTRTAPGQESRISENERNKDYIDVVFYSGEETDINFDTIKDAYAVVAFSMGKSPEISNTSITLSTEASAESTASVGGHKLRVTSPIKPLKRAQWFGKAYADNVDIDQRDTTN